MAEHFSITVQTDNIASSYDEYTYCIINSKVTKFSQHRYLCVSYDLVEKNEYFLKIVDRLFD